MTDSVALGVQAVLQIFANDAGLDVSDEVSLVDPQYLILQVKSFKTSTIENSS